MSNSSSAMSHQALIEILHQSSQATAIFVGPDLRIQMVNRAMLEIWGRDVSVMNSYFEDAVHGMQGHPATMLLLEESWSSGEVREGKEVPLIRNGTTRYFDYLFQPITYGNDTIFCILHTQIESTDRVRTRQLLQEKEEREQSIAEALEAANEEYMATNEELSAARNTLSETYDKLIYTEHRMQELIRTTPVGLALLRGKDMVIETANPAMLDIWKSSGTSVIGEPLLRVFPSLARQQFSDQLNLVYRSAEKVSLKEIIDDSHLDNDGNGRYLDIEFHPLLDPRGEVDAIMATAQDVTDRVTARKVMEANEVKLQEYTEELAVMNEEMQTTNEELAAVNEEYNATNEQLERFNQSVRLINLKLEEKNKGLTSSNSGFRAANDKLNRSNDNLEGSNLELVALNNTFLKLNGKLSESENGLRNLIAQAPIAIMLVKGDDFIVTMVNSRMLELIGRGEEIVGRPLFEELPELKGQDAADQLIGTYTDGNPRSELSSPVTLMRNGVPRHGFFNFSYAPLIEDGQTTGVIDMALEVTPQVVAIREREETIREKSMLEDTLRKSEQRLQGILETMAEGVGIIDVTGKLVYANPMAQRILGLTLSEIEDRTYDDPRWQNLRIDGSALPQEEHPMSIMMESGKPVFDHEIGVQPPDGERFYISINAAPILDEEGRLTGGIGTFMDVTTRRMIAQGKDDFISIASHELKTPVTSLKASLQLLERAHDRLPGESREKLIGQSIRSLESLSKLINDLLDTGRIDRGHLKVEKTRFQMHDLLVQSSTQAVQEGNRQIVFEGEADITVEADEQQIGQVLVNFVTNAIKYAPGSDKIIVRTSIIDSRQVKVSVIDAGPGIPTEKLKYLFDRYYRTDYRGQKFSGLGLGLYISAEIIRNHGGKIGADSEQGKGSEFWFTLPIVE